jgi:hypothetical protein
MRMGTILAILPDNQPDGTSRAAKQSHIDEPKRAAAQEPRGGAERFHRGFEVEALSVLGASATGKQAIPTTSSSITGA